MAITLGDLRTFCQEIASPNSSGLQAERDFMVWINAALIRIYTEFQWDEIDSVQKITILPVETGDLLTVTQGSLALVLTGAETFLAKYVTDEWSLSIDGESRFAFELASIDDSPTNQNATLKDGDEWIGASGSGTSYTFAKTKYTLPDDATRIQRVEVLRNGLPVHVLSPQLFDRERAVEPTQTGAWPRVCCFRNQKIEIWPHPGDSYLKLEVSYRKGPPNYSTADTDATTLDWPEKFEDLLQKAIQLEAALALGESSPVPFGVLAASWEECLNRYKALDANKAELTGPIILNHPTRAPRFPWSYSGGTARDA